MAAGPALASPWAEVGDNGLRSDLELLASAGLVSGTTHWPIPWLAISRALSHAALQNQPEDVRDAAQRVLAAAHRQTADGWQEQIAVDATNRPALVRDFSGLGRGDGQAQFSLSYSAKYFSGRLALGGFTPDFTGHGARLMADGSYAAVKLGGAQIYAGEVDHWWGPGWISALSLSNNAPPMPQIGIERLDNSAFTWPVLRWLGPWQAEFFVGLLDGPRIDKHTLYNALRVTFSPAPGLEIGLARTQEFCGEHHACKPLKGYFDLRNDPTHTNITNDEGLADIKYDFHLAGTPVSAYLQLMNEDSSPFVHSGTSHLIGLALWRPLAGQSVRWTVEYADSVATDDIFSFGRVMPGFSYNNYTYLDGMRYRGRTLGFSLDSDSRLLSLQLAWTDSDDFFYQLSLHHADISSSANTLGNAVTAAPVAVDLAEAKLGIPINKLRLDIAARLQDDQPRPHKGFGVALETGLSYSF